MKVLIAAGGTGGHVNPALAVAGEIRKQYPDAEICFVGTADRIEAKIVPAAGFPLKTIEISGFKRGFSPADIKANVKTVTRLLKSSGAVKKIINEFKPDVAVGFGGYVSGPVIRMAAKMGIPTAIHEQNAYPGVTTKMLAPNVDAVMLAMPEAEKFLKLKKKPFVTGNPVRQELLKMTREEARKKLGINDDIPMILSFGGSLGAMKINQTVSELIKWHNNSGKIHHIHATGKSGYDEFMKSLEGVDLSEKVDIREYIVDMDVCMAAADIVICRAGAITLSELLACGKASILIPSPYVAENHQYHNAMTLKRIGAAEVIEEKDLSDKKLIEIVSEFIEDKQKLKQMSQAAANGAIMDANERIYEIIMRLYTNA